MRNPLTAFIRFNQRLSTGLRYRLPYVAERPAEDFLDRVEELMNARDGQLVVDVGGGRSSPLASRRGPGSATRIVAVDVDAAELALNEDADETRVADASVALPFEDETVDLIVSRSTIEHLPDVARFVEESARVLKPGGFSVHVFPGRHSPYALINRALPERVSQRLIHFLVPGSEGVLGFPTHYDQCSPRRMEAVLRRNGFDDIRFDVAYEQAFYFDFFFPLYLAVVGYDLTVRRLRARNLAALILVTARKRDGG